MRVRYSPDRSLDAEAPAEAAARLVTEKNLQVVQRLHAMRDFLRLRWGSMFLSDIHLVNKEQAKCDIN